jgi:RND family efflux transporter MFP subunit
MKKSTIITALILLAIFIFIAFKLISNKKELNDEVYKADVNKPIIVSLEKVSTTSVNPSYSFSGSFEPNKEVQVLPERSGRVTATNIELGDYVKKGSLIAKLDNNELQLQLSNSQTQLNDATRDYERNKVLLEGEAVTKNTFDKSELAYKAAKNGIAILRKQMTYLNVYAAIDGYVTFKNFEKGSIISPGQPIATITDIAAVKLVILIPENAVSEFKEGMLIAVFPDAFPDKELNGKVEYIAVKADDSKNFTVKITVPNGEKLIRSGMFGKATFQSTKATKAMLISRNALIGSAKQPQVYVIKNNKATIRNVVLGRTFDNAIEVLSGLTEGEIIANGGLVNLFNGALVTTSNTENK